MYKPFLFALHLLGVTGRLRFRSVPEDANVAVKRPEDHAGLPAGQLHLPASQLPAAPIKIDPGVLKAGAPVKLAESGMNLAMNKNPAPDGLPPNHDQVVHEEFDDFEDKLEKNFDDEQKELEEKMAAEIDAYHQIKVRIQFLEDHLKKHADFNLISLDELTGAAKTLQDLKDKIINPLETNLLAVRKQVSGLHHSFNPEERAFVKSVMENADAFLKTSKARIDNMELVEQDWESQEEGEKIKSLIQEDNRAHPAPLHPSPRPPLLPSHRPSLFPPPVLGLNQPPMLQKAPTPLGDSIRSMSKTYTDKANSTRLNKIKQAMKEKKAQLKAEKTVVKVDIHRLKEELERERMMDTEPGYKHKIEAALDEAKEMSHKFIEERVVHHTAENNNSWPVILLGTTSVVLFLALVLLAMYKRNPSLMRKRNLFKVLMNGKNNNGTVSYSELDNVRADPNTGITTGIANSSWGETSWSTWDEKNSQKLK